MEVGKTYQHTHCTELTCNILELTNKGCKVKQFDSSSRKKKDKEGVIKFYDKMDFVGGWAQWKIIN
jgi:hypothetical protein